MRLSIKHSKIISIAIEEAYRAKQVGDGSFYHGSVIVTNNRILGKGYNHPRTSFNGKHQLSMHAEVCALNKSILKPRKTLDVYVVRINKEGQLRESRPCILCIRALKENNVRKVYYSKTDGLIYVEKVKYME